MKTKTDHRTIEKESMAMLKKTRDSISKAIAHHTSKQHGVAGMDAHALSALIKLEGDLAARADRSARIVEREEYEKRVAAEEKQRRAREIAREKERRAREKEQRAREKRS